MAGSLNDGALIDFSLPPEERVGVTASTISALVQEGCTTTADPVATLGVMPMFNCAGGRSLTTVSVATTLPPGNYCGGILVQSGATLNLAGGTYIIGNGDLELEPGAALVARDATIALGRNSSIQSEGAVVDISGSTTGTFAGFAIYQEAKGTVATSTVDAASNWTIDGTVYLPHQDVEVDSASIGTALGGHMRWVSNSLDIKKSTMTINATPTMSMVTALY